jgi:hypothetical protein
MILIRAFKVEDYETIDQIESIDGPVSPELAQAIEDSSLAITGIKDGRAVACGGVHPVDDFHGEMWLRVGKECVDFPVETMRWIKEAFQIIEETYTFKQLNATIKCGFEKSIKMIEYLGFTLTEYKEVDGEQWAIYSKRIQHGIN